MKQKIQRVKVELKDVGRSKYSGEFFAEGNADTVNARIYQELTKYLISTEIDFNAELNGEWGDVVVGGFRPTGKIKISEVKK